MQTAEVKVLINNTVNPLLNPQGGGGGGLFYLAKMLVSALHKKLECKVEKLNYKESEVIQLRIKNKSELRTCE